MATSLRALCCLCFALALATPNAWAQESSTRSASEHFDRGVELYREGSLDAALVEFERAYELMPDYRLLFNLAQVQVERGEYVAAHKLFEQYMDQGGSNIERSRRDAVTQELQSLRKRIGEVAVDSNVPDAEVLVNGVNVGTTPLKERIRVNAGTVELTVQKRGYSARSHTVKVAGEERARVVFQLEQELKEPPAQRERSGGVPTAPPPRTPNYLPFWISTGVTTTLAATAGVFGYLAIKADKNLSKEYDKLPADPKRVHDFKHQISTYGATSDGVAAGAIVAAAIAIYYLVDPPLERAEPQSAGALELVPQSGGVALKGVF